ncbi:hypothetical protein HMPREF1582_00155 [Gardnerella vaginalis JCP8151A]|nr:hypothetical protein HMPREF1582_00155 [Gardnerella vaginalis JCP8151A]
MPIGNRFTYSVEDEWHGHDIIIDPFKYCTIDANNHSVTCTRERLHMWSVDNVRPYGLKMLRANLNDCSHMLRGRYTINMRTHTFTYEVIGETQTPPYEPDANLPGHRRGTIRDGFDN